MTVPVELAERIGALIDGELSDAEASALLAELEGDPAARALLKSLKVQRQALADHFHSGEAQTRAKALVVRWLIGSTD